MIRFLFFVFLFTQAASAKIKAEDLRFDGRLDFGIKDGVTESSDEIYELEIDVETKRNNGNKLEIEIESNSETNVFQLNEGFVDHEFQSQNRLLFGKGKKTLGFEYENVGFENEHGEDSCYVYVDFETEKLAQQAKPLLHLKMQEEVVSENHGIKIL